MEKIFIVVAFVAFSLLSSGYAQEAIDPNGYNVFYYPNGQKSSEGLLKDGQPEGWWRSYNEQGVLVCWTAHGLSTMTKATKLWL